MKVKLLYSSSSGNSTIITAESGALLVVDAGVSYKKMIEAYGDDFVPQALFITHDHGDHISGAGVLGRKTKCPIYLPKNSYEHKKELFSDCTINFIEGGETVEIEDFVIHAFNTKHDSKAGVAFIITEKSSMKKLGFLTDTGGITKLMREELFGCNAYFIETDYDEEELEKCAEYDDILKERIRSPFGHLSNQQTLDYLNTYLNMDNIEWVAFGHLSQQTNSPEVLRNRIEYKVPKKYWDKLKIIDTTTELSI